MIERPDRWCERFWKAPAAAPRPRPLVLPVFLWLAAIGFIIVAIVRCSEAQAAGVSFDCRDLAGSIARFTDFRDTGAKVDLVVRMARERNPQISQPHMAVIEREIRRIWRERLTRDQAELRLYTRCIERAGDMGTDI